MINLNKNVNELGRTVSLQVSKCGIINLATNFTLNGIAFKVKNDSDLTVTLSVKYADNTDNTFISTTFASGWNPDIIVEIQAIAGTNLKWGQ